MAKIMGFGEVLLRLSNDDIENNLVFNSNIGGAELNVVTNLVKLGSEASFITALPDNAIGRNILSELSARNIDVLQVQSQKGNMGIYFFNENSSDKSKAVVYNRENSVIGKFEPSEIDFSDVEILCLSGINSELNKAVHDKVIEMIKLAKNSDVKIAFDFNYRPSLETVEVMKSRYVEIIKESSIVFMNDLDCKVFLDIDAKRESAETIDMFHKEVMKKWDNIEVIASTFREEISNDKHAYVAAISLKNDFAFMDRTVFEVKERMGGGDAFVAGIMHGLLLRSKDRNIGGSDVLSLGVNTSIRKHLIPGDSL